jgi:hypothetical protein
MSEKLLDDTYISTVCQERSRETVTEGMSVEIFEYTSTESVVLYHIGYEEAREADSLIGKMDGLDIFCTEIVPDEKWCEAIPSRVEVYLYSIPSYFSQVDDTDFSSLSSYGELHGIEIYIVTIEPSEFRDTEPSRVDTLTNRIVALPLYISAIDRLEKSPDLIISEKSHFSLWGFQEIEDCRIETGDLLFLQILEPGAKSDDVSIYTLHREIIFRELEAEVIDIFLPDIRHSAHAIFPEDISLFTIRPTPLGSDIEKYLSMTVSRESSCRSLTLELRFEIGEESPEVELILLERPHAPTLMEAEIGEEFFERSDEIHVSSSEKLYLKIRE